MFDFSACSGMPKNTFQNVSRDCSAKTGVLNIVAATFHAEKTVKPEKITLCLLYYPKSKRTSAIVGALQAVQPPSPPLYNSQRQIVRAIAVSSSPRPHVPHHLLRKHLSRRNGSLLSVRTRRVSRYTITYRIVTHRPVYRWVVLFYDRRGVLSNS